MRTTFLIIGLLFVAATFSKAQKGKKNTAASPEIEVRQENPDSIEWLVYNKAIEFGDFNTAINSLYRVIVRDPGNLDYLDSLASLYFVAGEYVHAIIVGRKYLEARPLDLKILEIVANAETETGRYRESLDLYEKLERLTGDLFNTYQVAILQLQLKRIGEGMKTLDKILLNPGSKQKFIPITSSGSNQPQDVPIIAAAHNLKGVMFLDINERIAAIHHFEKALEEFPEFILAKRNLEHLNKETLPQKNK